MATSEDHEKPDVTVVGAGMGGLVAAVQASECGGSVVVYEKGPRAGGSMYLSSGTIWTYDSYETANERIPDGNPQLQKTIIDSFIESIEWLRKLGIRIKGPELGMPGWERNINPADFTSDMTSILEENGSTIHLRSPVSDILTDKNGNVTGVSGYNNEGKPFESRSNSVILATGGFQGNEEMINRHITNRPEHLRLRSNPWSTGDGMILAKEIGAKTTNGMGNFYGHNLLARPAEFSSFEFREASQYYGPMTIAIDKSGRRYTDESDPPNDETLAQDTAKYADGRGFFIFDKEVYDKEYRESKTVGDIVRTARDYQGLVCEAESLCQLESKLNSWGVNGSRAIRTIDQYNDAITSGSFENLDHPRTNYRFSIENPPFYAVGIQPGITFTMGGLAVTEEMRVLRRSTTCSFLDLDYVPENGESLFRDAFDSLFAVGVDVGNVNNYNYMGGLSQSLVTGRIAGKQAVKQ